MSAPLLECGRGRAKLAAAERPVTPWLGGLVPLVDHGDGERSHRPRDEAGLAMPLVDPLDDVPLEVVRVVRDRSVHDLGAAVRGAAFDPVAVSGRAPEDERLGDLSDPPQVTAL